MALRLVLDNEPGDGDGDGDGEGARARTPTHWHLRFVDDGEYTLACDGGHWTVTSAPPENEPDVTVVTTTTAWMSFLLDATQRRADDLGIELAGTPAALRRFTRLLRRFPAAMPGGAASTR
jgi:hypothetical protein